MGLGAAQFQMVAQAVLLGGNVRVGLEDNIYLSKGKLATNETLVEGAAEVIQRLGGDIASTKEAREILNLPVSRGDK